MKKLLTTISNTFAINYNSSPAKNLDKVNPDLVRYFKNEYGKEWEIALDNHLYIQNRKNDKKAA